MRVRWQALFLPEFEEDLEGLRGVVDLDRVRAAIQDELEDPFKADRLTKFIMSGMSSSAVERLAGSRFRPSVRMRILGDLRVTAWCYPGKHIVMLTHVFHKSSDPDYKRACQTHDRRLEAYLRGMVAFWDRNRRP